MYKQRRKSPDNTNSERTTYWIAIKSLSISSYGDSFSIASSVENKISGLHKALMNHNADIAIITET